MNPVRIASCRSASLLARAAALGGLSLFAAPAMADDVFRTETPFGGFLGLWGMDVISSQSVAARFIPATAHTLDTVSIWFMSNDWEGTTPQNVTITLRTDANPGTEFDSVPSETILETWTATMDVVGWNPVLVPFTSTTHVELAAGQKYWVVAESNVEPQLDPVWNFASVGNEFTANTDGPGTPWESGSGAALAFVIEDTPAGGSCPADFNQQDGVTVQDIYDFLADWNSQIAGGPVIIRSADFNGQGGVTVQDIYDFLGAWNTPCTN